MFLGLHVPDAPSGSRSVSCQRVSCLRTCIQLSSPMYFRVSSSAGPAIPLLTSCMQSWLLPGRSLVGDRGTGSILGLMFTTKACTVHIRRRQTVRIKLTTFEEGCKTSIFFNSISVMKDVATTFSSTSASVVNRVSWFTRYAEHEDYTFGLIMSEHVHNAGLRMKSIARSMQKEERKQESHLKDGRKGYSSAFEETHKRRIRMPLQPSRKA